MSDLDFYTLIHKYRDNKGEKLAVKTVTVEVKELPLKARDWEEALEIYENNQNIYLDEMEKGKKVVNKAKELEKWFCSFKEPKPEEKDEMDDWAQREKKRKSGVSAFCDSNIRKLLKKKNN